MARLSFSLKLASPSGLLSKDIYHGLALEASNSFTAEISIASFFYREEQSSERKDGNSTCVKKPQLLGFSTCRLGASKAT